MNDESIDVNSNNSMAPVIDKTNKFLSFSQLQDLLSRIYNGCKRNRKHQNAVSKNLFDMVDIIDGREASSLSDNFNENMDSIFPKIVSKYKNSFSVQMSNQEKHIMKPPAKIFGCQYASSKRIMSDREKNKRGILKNTKRGN